MNQYKNDIKLIKLIKLNCFYNNIFFIQKRMDEKMLNTIEQYILFAFANEPTQNIYSQFLSLEGQELINFAILFISGDLLLWTNTNPQLDICFESWYYNLNWREEDKEKLVSLYELFEMNPEFDIIVNKLNDFHIQKGNYSKDYRNTWKIELLTDYMDMHLASMNADELKEYIISLVDPIQLK
jgi:hypothetical protein